MGAFLKIWSGQFCSTLGSYMTVFALMIWVWDQTQSVTALTLVGFFSQIPRLVITPFAGVIVDRYSRKTLLLLSDIVAAICTVAIAVLVYFNQLEIWHLYCLTILYGGFGQIQTLAYSTSIALLVEKKNYARAESLVAAVNYGAA
ncbi:MAG: MFS transporter, partial [Cyanobacteria bacterium P01_F01_bin.42]